MLLRFMLLAFVLISLIVNVGGPTLALQPPEQNPEVASYLSNEFNPRLGTFYYVIHWVDSKVADATITVDRNGDFYRMIADEETTKFLDRIYRIKYRGETVVRAADMAPVETVINQELGGKNRQNRFAMTTTEKPKWLSAKQNPIRLSSTNLIL